MEQWQVCFTSLVVRAVAEHLNQNVRCAENVSTAQHFSTRGNVIGVWIPCLVPCPRFNDDFKTCLGETGNCRRHEPYAPFPWESFSRDAYNHSPPSRSKC